MKRKENFMLRQVADTWVVLPLGQAGLNFNGMLSLNGSGALLWEKLEQDSSRELLADTLAEEYDVERKTALRDVDAFLEKLRQAGCLEE